jgi:hypothetical protein
MYLLDFKRTHFHFVAIYVGSKCRIVVPWFYLTTVFLKGDISTAFIIRVVLFVYFTTLLVYRTVASMLRLVKSGEVESIVKEKQLLDDWGIVQTFASTENLHEDPQS